MEKKWALVTGANKGIGFEVTRQMAFKGYSIVMTGRNKGRLDQAAGLLRCEGHDILTVVLDVTDDQSIASVIAELKKQNIVLNALINNAAILVDRDVPIKKLTKAMVNDTLQTNTVAPLFLTLAMEPLLADGARVVMVSSGAGSMSNAPYTWAPIYSTSKTALNALTRQLAPFLAERNIAVNAVSPGWVRTDMGGSNAERHVKEGAETPVWLATEVPTSKTGMFWRDKKEIAW